MPQILLPPLPPVGEYVARPGWEAIDFISDLHLAVDTPRTFDAWSAYMQSTPADAVLILGDLFEAWVGDDARHSGFERECAAVLARAAQVRVVAFMAGNRDFLVGHPMLSASGVLHLDDPTVLVAFGRRTLLTHGDTLCIADVAYQRYRDTVRSEDWRSEFLSRPLDERRRVAQHMRDASKEHKRTGDAADWPEVDRDAAMRWLRDACAGDLVHGHTHQPASEMLAPGHTRHVLSDWQLDSDDPSERRAEVLRFTASGFSRLAAAAPRNGSA
jgi:UDP-2,3-diacylglucosamine hydrolase